MLAITLDPASVRAQGFGAMSTALTELGDAPEMPARALATVYSDQTEPNLLRVRQVADSTIYRRDHGISERAA